MLPLGQMGPRSSFIELYAQGAVGFSLAVSTLVTGSPKSSVSESTADTSFGFVLGGHAGAALAFPGPLVFYLQGGYEHAPTLSNLVGDRHDSGGLSTLIGARFRFE